MSDLKVTVTVTLDVGSGELVVEHPGGIPWLARYAEQMGEVIAKDRGLRPGGFSFGGPTTRHTWRAP